MKFQTPKGTKDIYYEEARLWQFVERVAQETCELANFKEIRTPVFEYTELFARGVGETTDIVNKEMYTFVQQDRSFTLRPENTAGVVRAYIQGGLFKRPSPQKLWYKGPMFRYERPQSGRYRQFHQIGMEMFGISDASADAEVILVALKLFKNLNLKNLSLNLNNIGCPECRQKYKDEIKESLKGKLDRLCGDCKNRYNTNPLRLLDCKIESCQEIYSQEPTNSVINKDFICEKCSTNFELLKEILTMAKVDYKMNKKLVRGLDYYNGPVFEILAEGLGAQNAICGGGRYDGLVELLGGPSTYAVGWALGVERIVSLLSAQEEEKLDVYVVSDSKKEALILADILRNSNLKVEIDFSTSKIKKQLYKANNFNAKFAVIIREEERNNNSYTVKNLKTGDQFTYDISDTISCLINNK